MLISIIAHIKSQLLDEASTTVVIKSVVNIICVHDFLNIKKRIEFMVEVWAQKL